MKNSFAPLITVFIVICSCHNPSGQNKTASVATPDTAGYHAASGMKGFASFKIRESTYKEVLNLIKEEIRKDSRRFKETDYKETPKYIGYQEKYEDYKFDRDGNIAGRFFREDFGSVFKEVEYDTLIEFLKEDILNHKVFGCPDISEIKMFQYYIGDIELMNLSLKFQRDTLYEISFYQNDKVDGGFITKYGEGKYIENNVWKTPFGTSNKRPENENVLRKSKLLEINERRTWENWTVKTVSSTHILYKEKGSDMLDNSFTISLKDCLKMEEIRQCGEAAFKAKERLEKQKEQKDIDLL